MFDEENQQSAVATKEAEVTEPNPDDIEAAVKDAEKPEPKYTEEQWSGLLRDKQAATSARQQAQADAAALRAQNELLLKQLEEKSSKAAEPELSEEQLNEPVNRAELMSFGKKMTENIAGLIENSKHADATSNLKSSQQADALKLNQTHTVKNKGVGLDAKTVLNEGTPYLQINHTKLYEAALNSPDAASKLYQLCVSFVPTIQKRHQARQHALLAAKLDESDTLPAGGGGGGGGAGGVPDGTDVLEAMMYGDVPEPEQDKIMGRAF
jgi:hypothetical protein